MIFLGLDFSSMVICLTSVFIGDFTNFLFIGLDVGFSDVVVSSLTGFAVFICWRSFLNNFLLLFFFFVLSFLDGNAVGENSPFLALTVGMLISEGLVTKLSSGKVISFSFLSSGTVSSLAFLRTM